MSKRLICSLLSAILVLCPMSLGAYGAETVDNSQLRLLRGLDIVCGLDENKLDSSIPKSTFINYALNITGDNKYADYYDESILIAAEQMGVISSAADISKADALPADDAITIAVRVLGYELMAKEKGGYPSGYMKMGTQLGLLDGVTLEGNITYAQAVALLVNVIECDYSGYAVNQSGNYINYDQKENVLEHFRGIYSVEAVISADSESDLYGDAELRDGLIKVGEEICYEGDSDAKELLGHYAEVYLKKTKGGIAEIIYADDRAKSTLDLDSEYVESVENNMCKIGYYKDDIGEKLYELQIAADAAFALNGVSYPQCTEADFKKNGTIINLVDNDGDRKYDFVNLEHYDIMIVSGVSVASMKIYNEYTFDEGTSTLDLSNYNKDKIYIFKDDAQIELSGIEKGDVLYVYRTPKGTEGEIRIYAETNQLEGTVERYYEAADKIVVDGTEYELSNLYINANKNNEKAARTIKPGASYTFGYDRSGRIIFAKDIQGDELLYGYAVKLIEWDNSFETEVAVKMFMEDGSWKNYNLADKLKWNGNGSVEAAEIYNNSEVKASIPGLIGIKLNNDGEIIALETPVNYVEGIDDERLNTTGEVTANYRYNGTTFSNYYYMTSQTKVFIIPEDASADESSYAIGTNTSFKSDASYTFKGYNRDEYYILDMVVSKRDTNTIKTVGDTLYMVREIGTLNDDVHGIVPYVNVASNTYAGVSLCGEEGVFDGIKEGDLIKIHTNSIGLIDNCSVIYSVSNGAVKELPTVSERHSASSVVKGTVKEIDAAGGRLLVETTEEMAFMVSASIPVLIYDTGNKKVTVGNLNDIEKGDFINVSLSRSLVNILAIYKGL